MKDARTKVQFVFFRKISDPELLGVKMLLSPDVEIIYIYHLYCALHHWAWCDIIFQLHFLAILYMQYNISYCIHAHFFKFVPPSTFCYKLQLILYYNTLQLTKL